VTPGRWQEVKQMLAAVLERRPEERTAYLDKACTEPEVRREVESLLRADGEARSTFLTPPGVTSKAELASGSRVGAYGRIGAGGMG
jgi:eukaryotic-like serine/threonine-protein kinase